MNATRTSTRTGMLGLLLTALFALSACGTDLLPDRSAAHQEETAPAPADAVAQGRSAPERATLDQGAGDVRTDVITTGSVTVETPDPAAAAADFTRAVQQEGGRIDSAEESTRFGQLQSVVTARVPADRYQPLLDSLSDYGSVAARRTQSTDVGQERVDLEARRAALQTSIDRLTELMDEAATVEELLQAEESLTQRQAELDSLTGQLDHLADQVSMSTLTATFAVDTEEYQSPNVVERAWDVFLRSLESVLLVFVAVLPWLVILAALAALVVVAVRRRRRTEPEQDGEVSG